MTISFATVSAVMALSLPAHAQDQDARRAVLQPTIQELQKLLNDKKALAQLMDDQVLDNFNLLVLAAATDTQSARLIIEANRLDKQVGASSRGPGTTNLVSSGSVPRLLGFAVETGAITQTLSGTSVTFQTNPAGLAQVLARTTAAAGSSLSDTASQNTLSVLRRINVSATFDADQDSDQGFMGSYRQLQQVAAQIYLYNHRDPTHPAWQTVWSGFRTQVGNSLANATAALALTLTKEPAFAALRTAVRMRILDATTDTEIEQAFLDYVEGIEPFLPESISSRVLDAWAGYLRTQTDTYRDIARSQIFTIEYQLDRPPVQDAPAEFSTPAAAADAPDLSTLRLVWVRPFLGASDMTVNLSASFFNNEVAGMTRQVRDWQVSGKLDFPLGPVSGFSKSQFTLAALYMRLLESPLGVPVTVNGVPVDRTGSLGFFQARLRIPLADSGFSVPFSVTYASRTELVADESQLRGNVGFTLDLDKFIGR
jgi:hypothetical protein